MKYDAVIFDLFGTLIDNVSLEAYAPWLRELAGCVDAEPEAFVRVWRSEAESTKRSTGRLASPEEMVRSACASLGIRPSAKAVRKAADIRRKLYRDWVEPREGVLEALDRLRELGLKLGLMSGCTSEVPRLWPDTELAKRFDAVLFSCDLGYNKPDPRFYERMIEKLDVPAERCLYVGDGAGRELTGATEAGMDAVLICAPHEEQTVLQRNEGRDWIGPRIRDIRQVVELVAERKPVPVAASAEGASDASADEPAAGPGPPAANDEREDRPARTPDGEDEDRPELDEAFRTFADEEDVPAERALADLTEAVDGEEPVDLDTPEPERTPASSESEADHREVEPEPEPTATSPAPEPEGAACEEEQPEPAPEPKEPEPARELTEPPARPAGSQEKQPRRRKRKSRRSRGKSSRYRAILLGLYGTLVENVDPDGRRVMLFRVADHLGVDHVAFHGRWEEDEFARRRLEGDLASPSACIRAVCESIGVTPRPEAIRHAVTCLFEFAWLTLLPRQGVLPVLRRLKSLGWPLGCVGACSLEVPHFWSRTAFAPLFDATVFTCQERMGKDRPELLTTAAERLDMRPERCFYVGDGKYGELQVAEEAGMGAALLQPAGGDEEVLDLTVHQDWSGRTLSSLGQIMRVLR